MSNAEKFGGFNLSTAMTGYPPSVRWMIKAASSETQICTGDVVVENIKGQIETGDAVTPGESLYTGVAVNFGPANMETGHMVFDDPNAVYDCVSNGDDELLSTEHRGEHCNLELGISHTMQSQHKLDASSLSASKENDMLIMGRVSNVIGVDASTRVMAKFRRHAYAAGYRRMRRETSKRGRPTLFINKTAFDKTLSRAFGFAMKENDFREERIAYEIDRLLRRGLGEFDQRQLRKELDRHYPKLSGDNERWVKIVVKFSAQEA